MKRKRKAKPLTGYTLHLQTYKGIGQLAISYVDSISHLKVGIRPDILEIHNLLTKIQTVFPNLFITSNRAEHFNSVHDRAITYRGRKTPDNARKRLKSWILYKYYKTGLERFLIGRKFNIPYSILQKTYQMQIKEVNFI